MAVAMIGPKFSAWDKNGKPLAFGKLFTYQARTNSPKPTYQSEDQIVENTNPVILNGEGYADVYLSGSYKIVLKDSSGNEIWSSDPVSSSEPSEWVLCLTANYLSPTTFKVNGNFVSQYEPGRRVRINSNAPEYSYATIISSVFASDETTITVSNPIITTGIVESCISIVGPESSGEGSIIKASNLQEAIDSTLTREGDAIEIRERTTGSGGSSTWDAVLASSVSTNPFNIVQCIGNPDLALVLRYIDGSTFSAAWGLVGGVDETAGLQAFYQAVVDNNISGILEPKKFFTSEELLNESTAKNFNIYSPVGTAKITVTATVDRLVRMDQAVSFRHHNVNYDLDGNAAAGLFVRSTAAAVDLGDVTIDNCNVTNAAQTTQLADAVSIDVGGKFPNIDITRCDIDGVSRVDTARFCNGILVTGTVGIVNIKSNSVSNVTCPTNFFDADGITVFGSKNLTDTELDLGKCTIEDNDIVDCRGRFIKSQHSNTVVENNRGTISDNSVLIVNWRFADFQMSNGIITNNVLTYGSNVTADGGGSVSTAYARFSNKKNIDIKKSSMCSDNILKTTTKWSQVVLSEIENGNTSVKVQDNDFGESNVLVLHDGAQSEFTEAYYTIQDNTVELGVQLFDVTVDQTWSKMFVAAIDNSNIDTSTGHFRHVFPLGGTFSLESNFVVRGNSRMIERVEWVFDFYRLTQGNAFQHGAQLNTNRPFSGVGFTQYDGFVIAEIPENNLARWQAVLTTPPETFSSWRSVAYS